MPTTQQIRYVLRMMPDAEQDAREARTEVSKSFPTFFFLVGDEIRAIVAEWVNYLRAEKLFGFDDPLFPASIVRVGPLSAVGQWLGNGYKVVAAAGRHGVWSFFADCPDAPLRTLLS